MKLLSLIVLFISICGCLSEPLPWPQAHQNTRNTNLSPYTATKENVVLFSNHYAQLYQPHVLSSTPAIGLEGKIYISSNDNKTASFSETGERLLNYLTSGMGDFNSPAVTEEGIIYLTNFDGNLYAYNATAPRLIGSLLWRFAADNFARIQSSPSVGPDGVIYFGADDYQLYAVYPNGTKKWSFLTGESICQTAAVFDGKVFFGSWDSYLYCLNAEDGALLWSFKTGGPIWSSSPAITKEGTIYITSDDKYLYSLDIDGTLLWKSKTGGKLRSTPSIGPDGDIYVSCTDSHIYAYKPDGSQKWSYDVLEKDLYASPAISQDNLLYVGTASRNASNSDFLCIDGETGSLVWKVDGVFNSTATASIGSNGVVYFGSQDGYLWAISDSAYLKAVQEIDPTFSPPVLTTQTEENSPPQPESPLQPPKTSKEKNRGGLKWIQ